MDRIAEGHVGGFDADLVVDHSLDAGLVEGRKHGGDWCEPRDAGIGDDERAAHAEIHQIHSHLSRDARTEAHARSRHLKGDLSCHC